MDTEIYIRTDPKRRLMILALWGPLVFTLILAFLAHQSERARDSDSQWVLHTVEVKNQLEHLNFLVTDAETSQRGYLLTRDPNFLTLREKALQAIPAQNQSLALLIADNPIQVAADAQLQGLISAKLAIAGQSLVLAHQGNFVAAIQIVKSGAGKLYMDGIRRQVDDMAAEEDRLLARRESMFAAQARTQTRLINGLVLADIALIVGATLLIQFLQKTRRTAEARTHQANTRTERAEARSEQAIFASELGYRRLFEASPDGILILDAATGQVMDANPFMKDLLGYSQEEFLGRKLWEIGPFKGTAASKITFAELQHADCIHYEGLPLETKFGRRIEVEFISQAYFVDQKRLIQCNIRDITERKRAEAESRWKTAFLEAQVDSALDGILVVDNQGRKILQNRHMNELWKIPPEIAANPDDAAQAAFITNQIKNPRPFADKVAHLYSHPDEVSWEEIELLDGTVLDRYSSPVRDKAGKHFGRIWTFRDLTERRKLEAQLRQSQKMDAIGQLAGGVAHDFNNILAVIQLQAELLKAAQNLLPKQLDYAEQIGAATQRAAVLTRQLLVFSRKETLQPRDLDLSQSINDMTKMLRRILGEDVQMQFKFAMQSLFIHADAGMIDQVLMNLTVNARDAMPNGGRLVIETSAVDFDLAASAQSAQIRPGPFVCLSVSDTGCGIPPEILPKIFEPFFTTKDVGKGTGLGLATVFGIVQQHQGWVNADSKVGAGSTFRIYLPRLAQMSGPKPEAAVVASMRGGNETILLVEDDTFVRTSVNTTLTQLGYHVLEAANGVEALAVWKQHRTRINLLLTDLVLPGGLNGKDLAEQILAEAPRLKVIYASGYRAEMTGKDFHLDEGVNFLTKPFQATKLAKAIRDSLDKRG